MNEVATFTHGVPWGVLRIEGVGSEGRIPELDIDDATVAANDGFVVVAVMHGDVDEVAVTVTRQGGACRLRADVLRGADGSTRLRRDR